MCGNVLSSFQRWPKLSHGLDSGESATGGHCWNKDTTSKPGNWEINGFKFLQGELKSKGYEKDQSLPLEFWRTIKKIKTVFNGL